MRCVHESALIIDRCPPYCVFFCLLLTLPFLIAPFSNLVEDSRRTIHISGFGRRPPAVFGGCVGCVGAVLVAAIVGGRVAGLDLVVGLGVLGVDLAIYAA